MNSIDNLTLEKANSEAIYNVYSYLANKLPQGEAAVGNSFGNIVDLLREQVNCDWKEDELQQLEVLEKAVSRDPELAKSILLEQTEQSIGTNASIFQKPNGDVSVVFRGTGSGEWIDNGEGLSGISEENTYKIYDSYGNCVGERTEMGYATQQQMDALNWFNLKASEYGWDKSTNIIVTGHSKGGNKAQFVTLSSDLVDTCYSYDGQGFSPEALAYYEEKYGAEYEKRRQKMQSFSAYNDYVNVLGERLIPVDRVYFFEAPIGDKSFVGYHYMHAMLDENGNFNLQREQGEISEYLQNTSEEIMEIDPNARQYITLALMNLAHSALGGFKTVNGDNVSIWDTAAGLNLSMMTLAADWAEGISEKYGPLVGAGAAIGSIAVVRVVAPIVTLIGVGFVKVTELIKAVKEIAAKLEKFSKEIYAKVTGFINSTISCISTWANETFNPGYKYATANPNIKVNTSSLREYADRLARVNRRLINLDIRLDRLYGKVSLTDLLTIIHANYIVGYSWKINSCINYLNNTAADFESVERTIATRL